MVQIYVRDIKSSLYRPYKELKAFEKVEVKPGETVDVSLTLDKNAFAFYDPATARWTVEPGKFEILVGTASDAIAAYLPLTVATPAAWHD